MASRLNCGSYSVFLNEENALNEIVKAINPSMILVLADENTAKFCLHKLYEIADFEFKTITIHPGEANKTIETAGYIWKQMMKLGADRKSLLINLGGGVVGDIGGFCASCYMRGIRFIQMPTSLLAQVDSSVGGKTGIDVNHVKNIVGTFNFPHAVIIDTSYLSTLPYKELLSGFSEMLKHGLIASRKIWDELSKLNDINPAELSEQIYQSIEIKNQIVMQDPTEKGLRKILNFGHTIGHGLETLNLNTESHLLHGEAIAIGMVCEAYLSKKMGLIEELDYVHIKTVIKKFYGNRYKSIQPIEKLMPILEIDKKNSNHLINFSLLNAVGKSVYDVNVETAWIEESLNDYCNN